MNGKWKVTGLILGGYVLGRSRKLGLALTVASAVAGTTAFSNRGKLTQALSGFTESSPEFKSLSEKVTGRLAESGRNAARSAASKGIDQLSSRLQEQTEKMKTSLGEDADADTVDPDTDEASAEPQEGEDVAPEDAGAADEQGDEETAEESEPAAEEDAQKPARKSSSTRRSTSRSTGKSSGTTSRTGTSSRRKSSSSRSTSGSASTTRKRASSTKKPSTSQKGSTSQKSQGGDDE